MWPLSLCAVLVLSGVARLAAQSVEVSLPSVEVAAGETARIPVTVTGVPVDSEILSLNADLRFDASVLPPEGVDADRRGSLTAAWSLADNARMLPGGGPTEGQLLLAGATATASLPGDGTLLFLEITVPADAVPGASSPLQFELLFFNNGDPPVTTVDGLITVVGPRLKADFSGHPLEGAAPLRVNFQDLSSEGVTSWAWDFGDGTTSDEQSPSHLYETPETYTVSLTVSDGTSSATETKADFVLVTPDVTPPAIVEGPVAEGATHSSVTIRYKTNEAGTTEIQYCGLRFRPALGNVDELWRGLADDLGVNPDDAGAQLQSGQLEHFGDEDFRGHPVFTVSCDRYLDEALTPDHFALLEDLSSATFYIYRARSADEAGNVSRWHGGFFVTRLRPDDTPPWIVWARAVVAPQRVLLTWLTNEPANSFVSLADNELFSGDERTVVDENVVLHQVWIDVEPGRRYWARLRSTDGRGNSSTLKILRFRTPPVDIDAPVLLAGGPVVTKRNATNAVVAWQTEEPATSVVEYGLTEDYGAIATNALPVTDHSQLLNDLLAQTLYHYRVISVDASGNRMESDDNTFTTRAEPDVDSPAWDEQPHEYQVFHNRALIRWKANEECRAQIEFGLTEDFGEVVQVAETRREQIYTIAGLSPGATYYCRVWLTDLSGNGPTRSRVFMVRTAGVIDTEKPEIVGGVRIVHRTEDQITLTWRTNEPSDSEVEYGTSADELERLVSHGDPLREHEVTLTNLAAATTYFLRVSSTDAEGNTVTSELIVVTTRSQPSVVAVRIISGPDAVVVAADRVVIEWKTNVPTTSVVEYGATANFDQEVVVSRRRRNHRVVISGLEPSTDLLLQVSSSDGSEEAPATSRVVQVTTKAAGDTQPPQIRHAVVSRVTDNSAVFSFRTDEPAVVSVEVGASAGAYDMSEGSTRLRRRHQILVTGLQEGTTYHYRLVATDAAGNSTEGEDRTVTTDDEADDREPRITVGPTVDVSHNSATFVWRTDEECYGSVIVGTPATIGTPDEEIHEEDEARHEHRMTVTGLQRGARYLFALISTDLSGNRSILGDRGSAKAVRPLLQAGEVSFETAVEEDTRGPVFVSGPIELSRSDTDVLIGWETDEVSDSRLYLVSDGQEALAGYVSEHDFDHQVLLTGLQSGTTYTVVATSADPSGNGPARSPMYTFTTRARADAQAPRIEGTTQLSAVTDEAATLSFVTDEASSAVVRFGLEGGALGRSVAGSTPAVTHRVPLTGLEPATTYRYTLDLTDGVGNTVRSTGSGTFSTPSAADRTAPVITAGPTVERLTPTGAIIAWTTDEGADGFVHYGVGGVLAQVLGRAEPDRDHRVEITHLTPGATYDYQVVSADAWGNGPVTSTHLRLTTPATQATPQAPTDLSARLGVGGRGALTWSREDDAIGYNVYRSRSDDEAVRIAGPVAEPTYSDQGTAESDSYSYHVTAVNSAQVEGPPSESVTLALSTTPGDFDADGLVGLEDFFALADHIGEDDSDPGYDRVFDIDLDGQIGLDDLFLFVDLFGSRYGTAKAAGVPVPERIVDVTLAVDVDATTGDYAARVRGDVPSRAFGLRLAYDRDAVRFTDADFEHGIPIVLQNTPGELLLAGIPTADAPTALNAVLRFATWPGATVGTLRLTEADGMLADGSRWTATSPEAVQLVPESVALLGNTPNPFNPSTQIRFQLAEPSRVWLVIYDMLGQPVATLADGVYQPAGVHELRWRGRDRAGRGVASGVYFSVLRTDEVERVAKLLLLR